MFSFKGKRTNAEKIQKSIGLFLLFIFYSQRIYINVTNTCIKFPIFFKKVSDLYRRIENSINNKSRYYF